MKKVILPLLLLVTFTSVAQQKARLKKVTVYPRGAVLEHTTSVTLKKGIQTVILRGLATDIDVSSLMVEIDGYVNVLSHKYLRDYKSNTAKPDAVTEEKIKQLEKKIARLNKDIKTVQQQIAIENKSLEIILSNPNPKPTPETAMNVASLSGYVALYKNHAYETESKIRKLNEKQEMYNDSIHKISEKIQTLREDKQAKAENDSLKNLGYLELQLNAPQEMVAKLDFSYYSNHASWNASYDIISENIEKPLKVKYKANIFQSTGLAWNNVKISVSTSQPNRSNNQPILTAWYLDVYKGYTQSSEGLYNVVGTNSIPSFGTAQPIEINVMEQTGINLSFDSDMTYTIPSDNNQYIVMLKSFDLPATYKYYTVPKLDKSVFLLAEIQDFEQYNFLPGEAQVFLEGKFTGKTLLDPFVTSESINISLGRDHNIVVKREKARVKEKTKFLDGDRKIDEFKYNITVKNNRTKEISIIIKDQYPMTTNSKIVITDQDHSSGGELNPVNGVVTWIKTIGKTKTEEVSIGYKVTRPKDMVIPGL